jgi:Tfp pilus assembly protein PilN
VTIAICDINLIAARRRHKQRSVAVMRLATYSLITLLVCVAIVYFYMVVETRLAAGQIADVDAQLSDPALADKIGRIQFVENSMVSLKPRVELLEHVHDSEAAWIRILRDVSACIPSTVWVTHVASQRVDKGQSLSIKGRAFNQKEIGDFMLALDEPSWSGAPKLGFTQVTGTRDAASYIEFEITVPLKRVIGSELQ